MSRWLPSHSFRAHLNHVLIIVPNLPICASPARSSRMLTWLLSSTGRNNTKLPKSVTACPMMKRMWLNSSLPSNATALPTPSDSALRLQACGLIISIANKPYSHQRTSLDYRRNATRAGVSIMGNLSNSASLVTSAHRPTWAVIDLDTLTANFHIVTDRVGPNVNVMAVVKANAYGHGAVECARRLEAEGANWLGVALPEEGLERRNAGITA